MGQLSEAWHGPDPSIDGDELFSLSSTSVRSASRSTRALDFASNRLKEVLFRAR